MSLIFRMIMLFAPPGGATDLAANRVPGGPRTQKLLSYPVVFRIVVFIAGSTSPRRVGERKSKSVPDKDETSPGIEKRILDECIL